MDELEQMRQDIMICLKANGHEVTGEFWLMLIFRTKDELIAICRELNIQVKG